MTYVLPQGMPAPLCRTCGKRLKKYTTSIWPNAEPSKIPAGDAWRSQITSTRYSKSGAVQRYTIWDGKTYVDEFFCTNRCAIAFGRAAADRGLTTTPYNDALKRQRGEKVK